MSLSKLVAEYRLKPDLLFPVPGATALLALLTLTRDRACCFVMDSSITVSLAPPCTPIPVRFQGCLHCLPVHVLTRTYGSTCPEMAGQPPLPWVLYCMVTPVLLTARPPPPAGALPSLGMDGAEQIDGDLFCFWFWRFLSQLPSLPQRSPVCLRASPASVWHALSFSQSLEKVCFLLSLSAPGKSWYTPHPHPRGPCLGRPSRFTSGSPIASCALHHRGD